MPHLFPDTSGSFARTIRPGSPLCIDSSQGNVFEALSGYNAFLGAARGEYVILTHQDIELRFDDRAVLEERLRHLSGVAPS